MPTFYGPPSDGTVIPEQLETALAADIAAPESKVRQALDAAGLGQVMGRVHSTSVSNIVMLAEGEPEPAPQEGVLVMRYAVSGSAYYTDFSATAVGSTPADWTPRWKTFDTGWQVKADTTAAGGKVLSMTVATAERFAASWNLLDADASRADVEVLFRSKMIGATNSLPTAVGRASGVTLSETAYRGGGRGVANRTVSKYVAGPYTDLASDAFTIAADTWYLTRFRVNGSTIQVKVWADGSTEPSAWLTATDTSITEAGWVGLALTSNSGERQVDWVAAATGGRTAVKP